MRLAEGFLEAEGWSVEAPDRDLLRGRRPSRRSDDENDHIYVWVSDEVGDGFTTREGPYLRRFQEAREAHPFAEKILLVPSRAGLSSEFRSGARLWHGVQILVPVQFFDMNFRWESDRTAATASRQLRNSGQERDRTRIKQPFLRAQPVASGEGQVESDLLDQLFRNLRRSASTDDQPAINVVVGPAGMGKSRLFESLNAHLFDEFQDNKRAGFLSPRPFALFPDYSEDAESRTIGSLLDAYLRTEFSRQMDRQSFDWRLIHGLGIWLLDGLDEILEQDKWFFDRLEDLMTEPAGQTIPSVVIFVRDSLFSTHRGLNDFCAEYSNDVAVYRLAPWQHQSKLEFASIRLGSTEDGRAFVSSLAEFPAVDELTSTPYYCELLVVCRGFV